MLSSFSSLTFNLLPSTVNLEVSFNKLFEANGLNKTSAGRRISSPDISTRHLALRLVLCSLMLKTEFIERRICKLTIDPHSFTGVGFSRVIFDAIQERLKQNGYITFKRGVKTPKASLSSVGVTRKLIRFFTAEGFSAENFHEHLKVFIHPENKGTDFIEVKTNSTWTYEEKEKGKKVDTFIIKQHPEFERHVQEMRELNSFLFKHDLQTPALRPFTGLKRVFNMYNSLPTFQFNKGGRLYASDEKNYQQLNEATREQCTINGQPVVEADIHASFLTLAHSFFGVPLPNENDFYHIDGVHRDIIKSWINISLTKSKPIDTWPDKIKERFQENRIKFKEASFYKDMIINKFPFLNELSKHKFDWGDLQYKEATVILSTMQELMAQNIPSYPVHDALIVQEKHKELLINALNKQFYKIVGVSCVLK